jgi:Protein of unknown function (DUF2628)
MSIYTVYQPPLRAADAFPDPERFVFVRDGFSFSAFLLAALWMLWHQMWLVLPLYIAVALGAEAVLYYAGVPVAVIAIIGLLASLLLGIEAATLRRFTLARQGWKDVGIVSGADQQDAEQRFFEAWVHATASEPGQPAVHAPHPVSSPVPRMPQSPDVIGLFPNPGASP